MNHPTVDELARQIERLSDDEREELLNRIHRTVPVSTESTVILQTYF